MGALVAGEIHDTIRGVKRMIRGRLEGGRPFHSFISVKAGCEWLGGSGGSSRPLGWVGRRRIARRRTRTPLHKLCKIHISLGPPHGWRDRALRKENG